MDSGAQSSFISESLALRIGLKIDRERVPFKCPSSNSLTTRGKVSFELTSHVDNSVSFNVNAHVLPSIIEQQPQSEVQLKCLNELFSRFNISDPQFYKPDSIDLILSSSILFSVLKPQRFLNRAENILVQNTSLGWIVCNSVQFTSDQVLLNTIITTDEDCNTILEKFWSLEEPPCHDKRLSQPELECENSYVKSVTRTATGRFSVGLPFRISTSKLGSSYDISLRRFSCLKRKSRQDPSLKFEYSKFMSEYEDLGHMTQLHITPSQLSPGKHYVIPHHGIWKQGPCSKRSE